MFYRPRVTVVHRVGHTTRILLQNIYLDITCHQDLIYFLRVASVIARNSSICKFKVSSISLHSSCPSAPPSVRSSCNCSQHAHVTQSKSRSLHKHISLKIITTKIVHKHISLKIITTMSQSQLNHRRLSTQVYCTDCSVGHNTARHSPLLSPPFWKHLTKILTEF